MFIFPLDEEQLLLGGEFEKWKKSTSASNKTWFFFLTSTKL